MSVCDKNTNGRYYKSFTIIIYYRNDSQMYGQYYKIMNYDHKVCS